MAPSQYLTARQAAQSLGVTRATLYAYTSRGQLRSEAVAGRSRERRYHRDDVDRLKRRKAARRDPSKAAAQGLRWGEPVLESGITFIHGGTFYYRGQDAMRLAATATAEDVAALLWGVDGTDQQRLFQQPTPLDARQISHLERLTTDPLHRLQAALPIAAVTDLASCDLRPAAVRATGARILRLLTTIITGRAADARDPIHERLRAAWAPKKPAVADVVRAALVLCADHELNVSAFTARCAASAGASPYDVVSAAMATLKGYRHGGATAHLLEFVRHAAHASTSSPVARS